MNELKRLPVRISTNGGWFGKEGRIDFIGKDEEGRMLAAVTKWDDEAFGDKDFEQILFTMMQAGINPDYYYLFSKTGFQSSMEIKANAMENLELISLEQL